MTETKSGMKNKNVLAIILTLTFLSFAMVFLLFMNIDMSFFSEYFVMNNVEYLNTSTVYIPENYITLWNDKYSTEDVEFIYCLYGEQYKDGYIINDVTTTEVYSAKEDSITYKRCDRNRNYFGTIHSHPQPEARYLIATCDLSKQDIYTFGSEAQVMTGVICGVNKIALYGVDDFEKSFLINVVGDEE